MSSKRYAVVLDLDETLIHSADNEYDEPLIKTDFFCEEFSFCLRPCALQLVESLLSDADCEVVVWTSASKSYADFVVQHLTDDPNRFRLVYGKGKMEKARSIAWGESLPKQKSLFRISRELQLPLTRIVAVDDKVEFYDRHRANVIQVKPFTATRNELGDRELETIHAKVKGRLGQLGY